MVAAIYTGPAGQARDVLQPLRQLGTPLADLGDQMPYRAFQSALDAFFPKGQLSSYWKSVYLDELSDDLSDLIVREGMRRPSPLTMVHVPMLGGAMGRVPAAATAFGDRGAPLMLSVDGNWTDPAATDGVVAWVRRVVADAERFSTHGTYLSFSGQEETAGPDLVRAAYGENLERLRAIKRRYDPDNLFRMNGNIAPAPETSTAPGPPVG
jgi:FAD/FMN-containing dehydrogenase